MATMPRASWPNAWGALIELGDEAGIATWKAIAWRLDKLRRDAAD